MLTRDKGSHKGDNGRVLVVGGSERFHGAPILAALGAEKSGVDLVYLIVPKSQHDLARRWSLGVVTDTFEDEHLIDKDVDRVLNWCEQSDVMVIGNGLGKEPETVEAVRRIVHESRCDLVIDADGLRMIREQTRFDDRQIVLTPHHGEWSAIRDRRGKESDQTDQKVLKDEAAELNCTILLKGQVDFVVSEFGEVYENMTGDAVLTKGGTGDFLAGFIAGLMAQGMGCYDAACEGVKNVGLIGEEFGKTRGAINFTVEELLGV